MFDPNVHTTITIVLQSKENGGKVDTVVFSFIWCIPWRRRIYWFVWNIFSGRDFRKRFSRTVYISGSRYGFYRYVVSLGRLLVMQLEREQAKRKREKLRKEIQNSEKVLIITG